MGQVEYRLSESAGCAANTQTDYRLAESQATLEWIGSGLADVGIEAGAKLDGEADKDLARALMDGRDPRTGDVLVKPKQALDPRGKLAAQPLVDAVTKAAADAGHETPAEAFADKRRRAEFQRLARAVAKDQSRHKASVVLLSRVAAAAGVDLDTVYGADAVAEARKHAKKRVTVGNRGYDLELDVPKSYSVLQAVAPDELSTELDRIFREATRETVAAVEQWAAWGQRGKHGEGKIAARIETSGIIGWSMTHYTARPVDGQAPDPHLHVHLTFANMVKGTDGRWSAIGGGGRDVMRHAVAANAFLEARIRARSAEELGLRWAQDERTGAWEVAAVPAELRQAFSKRAAQVEAAVAAEEGDVSGKHHRLIAARTAEGKEHDLDLGDLRAEWQRQALEAGYDVEGIARIATVPGFADEPGRDTEAIAAAVWHPEHGLTAHDKVVSRADVMAAVADAAPGVDNLDDLESLTDAVLAVPGYAVQLDTTLPGTWTHPERYTSVDIADAEQTLLESARARLDEGAARVDPDVVAAAIEVFETARGFELSDEQRAVVERLATAGHGLDAVVGVAGAGKTTIMEALADAHRAAGHTVAGASTAAVAAHHLQAETGIPSATVASWLGRIERGTGLAGVDVLVIDEAAMVDDRQYARLVAAAAESGTQVVGIGDPKQLKSPGVGGAFADLHAAVDGLTLTDNRRQRHEAEVQALAKWREDDRRAIFDVLADRDAVHTEERLEGVWSAMIGSWWANVREVDDAHDRIQQHLMIAATNADVTTLNAAAQAIRVDAGELDPGTGRDYRIEGGQELRIHLGDVVAARHNDYNAGLLNGYRGVVTGISEDGSLTVAIRQAGPDGPQTVERRVAERYVRTGHLELGYAITGHRAQGQTADTVHASLTGMEANAAYAALTRHRDRVDVWLAADVVEDDATRARLGEPATAAERTERVIDAYVTYLDRPEADPLVLADLAARRRDLLDHRDRPRRLQFVSDMSEPGLAASLEAQGIEVRQWPRPRPFEQLDARDLVRAAARAHQAQQAAERGLADAQQRHEAYTAGLARAAAEREAARAGRGRHAARLDDQRRALAEAVALLDGIEERRGREAVLDRDVAQGYRDAQAARRRAEENPLKLRLQGTSRAEQARAADETLAQTRETQTERQALRDELYAAERQFRTVQERLPREGHRWMQAPEVRPAHADMETHWQERHAAAIEADLAAVRDPRPPQVTVADAAARLQDARTAAAGYAAELGRREADPAARAEVQQAIVEVRREAEAAQAAREAAQAQTRRYQVPRHDHSRDRDQGPDRGFSR
jgi:conjugative relaxase-like TrwC/TraI family protein